MKKKILVTGGAGYIGSHVVKALGKKGYDVVVYDNLSTGNRDAVIGAKLVVGDLSDLNKLNDLMAKESFEAVLHFAGSIIVPESVLKPIEYYQNNTVNSLNLIELCTKNHIENLVFSSTSAVYGIPTGSDVDESSQTSPINPYGQSKLMTELMLKDAAAANEKFNFVALRYFNVSGADSGGDIGQAFPGATHLIKVNCEAAAGKRDKTYIFGTDYDTPDGTGIRDYIHVTDLANAHLLALEYLFENKKSDIFNCGYGHGYSVREIVESVKEVTGVDFTVEEAPRREGDPAILIANSDKIKEVLGWKPQYDDLNMIIDSAYKWEKSETLSKWRQRK